jgi:histidinol-phosphatase
MNADWRTRYDAAVEAAQKAGKIALGYYPDEGLAEFQKKVEWKNDLSPVTVADKSAEAYLRSTLLGAFPGDGFLGEESGDQPGSSGYRWIIDPVDGTRSFVRGIPLWATLVGLEYKGEPIAGVTFVPALGHLYRALRGDGAYRGDRRISVSDLAAMDQAIMFYSSISWFVKAGRQHDFLDLACRTQRQRVFGDFYGFVLVAQGSGELMIEHGVHVWDVAGILPLVEEAGGRFSDWEGNRSIHRPDVIASNGRLHDEALAILRGNRAKH